MGVGGDLSILLSGQYYQEAISADRQLFAIDTAQTTVAFITNQLLFVTILKEGITFGIMTNLTK